MYDLTLKKLESTHNNLRTDEVQGLAPELPVVGKRFFMYADPINPIASQRYINTSSVKEIQRKGEDLIVKTENSTYILFDIKKAEIGL